MKLSILVPSVAERRNNFLPKSLEMLYGQLEKLPAELQKEVEIIYLIDNKTIMLGDKRNLMVEMANGKYISFVDCDDRVSDDYISSLLDAINFDTDSIVFLAEVSLNGNPPKICRYSKDYRQDYNTDTEYHRLPNHIPCIKKEVSKKVSFPSLKRAEDAGYAKLLKKYLFTEHKIEKVLYYYDYNDMTTVAQEDIPQIRAKRISTTPPVADVVIISNALNESIRKVTQQAVDSCKRGANGLNVNCIVIESKKGITYQNAITYNAPTPFNYNAYLNFGATRGTCNYIMFCNNDLVFSNGWLHSLINTDYPIVSPISPRDIRQRGINENVSGYTCGKHLSGWAFMMTRELWSKIGGLDEDFDFWYADNSLIEQLRNLNLPPMLVPSSVVNHLGSMTLNKMVEKEKSNLMWSKLDLFNTKYNQNLFIDHPSYLKWKASQLQ